MIFESNRPGMSSFPVIVNELRRMNLAMQQQRVEHMNHYHRCEAARMFQTVSVDGGRQCGKTTCLIEMSRPSDLIFAYGQEQAQTLDRVVCCPVYNSRVDNARWVRKNSPVHTVWIDEARFVSPKAMQEIYALYAGHAKQFVLLG